MPPKLPRIVSLDAAATEIVCLIGAGAGLVGRSPDSDSPATALGVPVLASASPTVYRPDESALRDLRPEVIFARPGCLSPRADTTVLDPNTIEGVFDAILTIGEALELQAAALAAVVALRERMFAASEYVNPFDDGPAVAVLQSIGPPLVGGYWIPQLVERAGGRHPLNATVPKEAAGAAAGPQMAERVAGPGRSITQEELFACDPAWVFLSLGGLSFSQSRSLAAELAQDSRWHDLAAFKRDQVVVVDGDRSFNRSGPGLAATLEFLVGLLHHRPEMIPADFAWSRTGK
ncbi:MAG: ABC transporter substrate-binding protein [Planctomycetota bacterium]